MVQKGMAGYINQNQYPAEFALHQKYAGSDLLLNLVWTHSHIIMEIALSLFDSGTFDTSQMDRNLVIKAGLMHDIGVYKCGGFEWIPGQQWAEYPYAHHTIVGAQILASEGYCQEIVRVSQVHTGMGLTEEDIKTYMINLPPGDYMPATPFEWLMTYVSKFHSKTPKFRTVEDIAKSLEKYGSGKVEIFQQLQAYYGIPDIPAFEQRYAEWYNAFMNNLKQLQESQAQVATNLTKTANMLNPAGIIPQNFWATPVGPS
jgi:uncharacterized protein